MAIVEKVNSPKKCLFLINRGANFKLIHEHVKKLNGFYNGTGWYVESKYQQAVEQICENTSIFHLDFPLIDHSFEDLKRQHKAAFYYEKSIKIYLEINKLREILNLPQGDIDEILKDEELKKLEFIPEGEQLINLISEYDVLQKRIKSSEEEEKLANLKLDTSETFAYLLNSTTEEEISQEIKNVSPGVYVGYKIGSIDVKIPGGAISIIAGPTSHGKTTQLINFTLGALSHTGQEDQCIYFFSYEESRAAIMSLFLNTYIGTNLSANNRESIKSYFRCGDMRYLTSEGNSRNIFLKKKKEFFENYIENGRLNIFYSELSTQELVTAIRYLKKNKKNLGMICIDYMQLLKLKGTFTGSRQEELKQVCLLLKDCAVETGVPILLAAQFNRQVTCEADLSPIYISEAGDIERVANLILGFWNRNFEGFTSEGNKTKSGKKLSKESTIYIEILKGREIGSGQSEVFDFDGNSGKLRNQINKNSTLFR